MEIVFIMFQGGGTPISSWDEGNGKFLTSLKNIGNVFVYQNKIYNTFYYSGKVLDKKEFDSDINFDINYLNIDSHITILFNEIKLIYDLKKVKLIPVAWSAGGYFCMAFTKKYFQYCLFQILLDSVMISKTCITKRLSDLKKICNKKCNEGIKSILKIPMSNSKLHKIQNDIKTKKIDFMILSDIAHNIWTMWANKNLSIKLYVPTLSFYNIELNKKNEKIDNELKIKEVTALYININYTNYFVINKTHNFFTDMDTSKYIIREIKKMIQIVEDIENPNIQIANLSDAISIQKLGKIYIELIGGGSYDLSLSKIKDDLVNKNIKIYKYINNDKIIGVISIIKKLDYNSIGIFIVNKKFRRLNIGSQLMEYILKILAKEGKQLQLKISKNNIMYSTLISFYSQYGFVEIKNVNNSDIIKMMKVFNRK